MENKEIKIQVFGSSCPSCKKLHEAVKESVSGMDFGTEVEVEYIDDIQKLLDLGVMSSPVLVVNGKVVLAGSIPSQDKVKQLITDTLENPQKNFEESKKSCGCCGVDGC